jgi:succinate dehydrogenase / fumarate reductase iron-sulfur subunit
MSGTINLKLKVWRQEHAKAPGKLQDIAANNISTEMSFLEMLDVVNVELIRKGERAIAFEHDCREGICGCCSLVINGVPHGPDAGTTVCQLHMRRFKDGETVVIEPFRAKAFPVIKDLVVDRAAFDKIIAAGGFISVNTGGAQDANATPVPKINADLSMDAAQCIGCGACVAACPNSSAMLFVAAKVSHLALLPQGHPEKRQRVLNMIKKMDELGFGNCSNHYECEAACPKEISAENIARMNREYLCASLFGRETAR